MTEPKVLPSPSGPWPPVSGPEHDQAIKSMESFAESFGGETKLLDARAAAIEKTELTRQDHEAASGRLQQAMQALGGSPPQQGASPKVSIYVQAAAFFVSAVVAMALLSTLGVTLDPVTAGALTLMLQGIFTGLATLYNNKIA